MKTRFSGLCTEQQMDAWLDQLPSGWHVVAAGSQPVRGQYQFWAYVEG